MINRDGTKRDMTDKEISEVMNKARNWVQPLGQEGNPTPEQSRLIELSEARRSLEQRAQEITGQVPYAEMASWPIQEAEARALVADPGASTPFIDNMVAARGLGETREELAGKIIANADYYRDQFAGALGNYQKSLKDIEDKYSL